MYESTHTLLVCASIITDTAHAPNARSCTVCHCNHLYLDYNRRPSNLYAAESCSLHIICSYSSFEPPFSLYFTQRDEKRLAAPKHRTIRIEVVLLIIYIFTLFNISVITLVNILYFSFKLSRAPLVENH